MNNRCSGFICRLYEVCRFPLPNANFFRYLFSVSDIDKWCVLALK
jgi:hypothetical protein